jgi:hypothetical protein
MAELMESLDELKLSPTAFANCPMEAMQTARINDKTTAYSTVVGPSSSRKNLAAA